MKLIIHIFYQKRLHLSNILIWPPLTNVVVRIMIKIVRSGRMTHPLQPREKSILTLPMISYAPFMYNWLMLLCICDRAFQRGNSCKVKFNNPHKK